MKFTVLTLFPQLLAPWVGEAIIGKAVQKGLLEFELRDIRSVTTDKHRTVDDSPYGGGAGMVMRVDVIARALEGIDADEVVMLSPAGARFTQDIALEFSRLKHVVLLCGRYEGFDGRVEKLVTREVSLGDFVMMGGEAAAACIIEATTRLIPGVLGDEDSHRADSFSSGLLDYPEFTRPLEFEGEAVPEILRGGNHAAIAGWRRREALRRTLERRPDLLPLAGLTADDGALLVELGVTPEQLEVWNVPLPPPKKQKRKRTPPPREN
jgi:tRNA (guanine37-N1)-methyltransferase